jgi:hypothetical protein
VLKLFKKIGSGDTNLQKVQQNVQEAIEPLIASQIIDGVLLKNVELTAGQLNIVFHGLGRELVGWIVVGQDANSQVWDEQAANPLKTRTLRLRASTDTVVALWVF